MKHLAILVMLVVVSLAPVSHAQGDTVEAGKRFTAGVALYNEADYRAALVEFKRAYDIAPSPLVLYNIGQTYYQLQDYAAAYTTLTRYLRDSGPNPEHKDEVAQTIQLLQARIGKIDVTTPEPGADVMIDDDMVGKTPLASPILVSIGRRRITVSAPGKPTQTRTVDVAAGDTIRQEIIFPAPDAKPLPAAPEPKTSGSSNFTTYAWVATGVLAAGTITFGILAWRASNELDDLRGQYPVSRDQLSDQSDKVTRYSYLADGFGVATVVTGGVALTFTLLGSKKKTDERSARLGIAPNGIVVGGKF